MTVATRFASFGFRVWGQCERSRLVTRETAIEATYDIGSASSATPDQKVWNIGRPRLIEHELSLVLELTRRRFARYIAE